MTHRNIVAQDWRVSVILASAAWGALLVVGTEGLSLIRGLNAASVALMWLAANMALWGALFCWQRRLQTEICDKDRPSLRETLRTWPGDVRFMFGAALLFGAFLGAIALLTPTTNWDSLTYHLARVMHWLQNQSVADYPTNMVAQLQMGPWPAFVQAHLWLLWGNDRFANMVQWSAMLGCMVVASLIVTQLLGARGLTTLRAQAFAAVLVVTLPTGIVESITTQTDYTTGFWLVCLASLALGWHGDPKSRIYAATFGATLGLGVLTKATFVIFGFPIGLATAVVLVWHHRRAPLEMARLSIIALVACFALALPHLIRNQAVFGSTGGSRAVGQALRVDHLTIAGSLSNLIRNAALHSNTGFPALTHVVNGALETLQSWTGRAPEDPSLSLRSDMYEPPDEFFVFDGFAASPWHVALIVIALGLGLSAPRRFRTPLIGWGLAFSGFVLFCTLLRWQIWNCRYHLPLLLLFMPVAAALIVPRTARWLPVAASVGLLAFGLDIAAHNRSRPIFDAAWRSQPRLEKLLSFQGVRYYKPTLEAATQVAAAGCTVVGLKLGPDDPEYALWIALRQAGFKGQIVNAFVSGPSARLREGPSRMPDVIVSSVPGRPAGQMAEMYPTHTKAGVYTLYWSKALRTAKVAVRR